MSEWMAITEWHRCAEMARPGIVFEIRNADGKSLLTPCVARLPATPFDWDSPPLQFRAIPEPAPSRSTPIPEPRG